MVSTRFVSLVMFVAAALFCAGPALADGTDLSATGLTPEAKVPPGVIGLRITVTPEQEQQTRRLERRLRIVRYAAQLIDGLVSSAGYSRFARTCLPCIAFARNPVGGRLRSTSALRFPAEADPVVQPISHGGFAMLAAGALLYDMLDARIERHWSPRARIAADGAEIGLHAYGLVTWQAANTGLAVEEKRAANCASLFQSSNATRFANYSGAIQWCIGRFADPAVGTSVQAPVTAVPGRRP